MTKHSRGAKEGSKVDFLWVSSKVAETVVQAIRAVREDSWRPFLCRLVLCGGLVYLPGLTKRLEAELKANLPSDWPLELLMEEEPEWSVWQGVENFGGCWKDGGLTSSMTLKDNRSSKSVSVDFCQ